MHVTVRGLEAEFHASISSTNDRCHELASEGMPHGTVIVADFQSKGRGRLGRQWLSPAGLNIQMSLLLRPDIAMLDAPLITLLAGAASAEVIERATGVRVMLKWPNDLFTETGRKLGGILVESKVGSGRLLYAVAGIGVNVNLREFPPELEGIASSLLIETGREHEREGIAAAIAETILDAMDAFSPAEAIRRWKARSYMSGRAVQVTGAGREIVGTAVDLDDAGRLVVRLADGSEAHISAGDVMVG